MENREALKPYLLAFPGPLRDRLVAAVLGGEKVSTTGLLAEYEAEAEELPPVGERSALIDSAGREVAVLEVTEVRVLPLGEVDLRHALEEGEGYASVAEWRAGHERFWHSEEMREALGDPEFTVDDSTMVVAERFRVVERLDGAEGASGTGAGAGTGVSVTGAVVGPGAGADSGTGSGTAAGGAGGSGAGAHGADVPGADAAAAASAAEVLDIVDEHDRVIGRAPRAEAYARGLRHRCVFVLARDAEDRVFVHRRTPGKLVFPSLYDMFVGGVVGAGESYDDAALREAEEELGVSGLPAPTPLFGFLYEGGGDPARSWWSRVYEVRCTLPVRPQPEEVAWHSFLDEAELAARLGTWEFVPDGAEAYRRLLAHRTR